jgi:hypothetical protein
LSSRSRFPRYRGRQDQFSCFAFLDSFSAVLRTTYPVFDNNEVVRTQFLFLCSRTNFRRHRVWRVPFSCFVLPDSFLVVPGATCPVFIFCASALVFGGNEDVRSRFHVLHSHTLFRRYRGRRDTFSSFELLDSFSTVSRTSAPVFMFCAPRHVFGGAEGVGSRFYVLRSRTHFFTVLRASSPIVMFCALVLFFGGTEGVVPNFYVLRARYHFWHYRVRRVQFLTVPRSSGPVFTFCSIAFVFGGTDGVEARFHVLRSWTHFW